MQVLRTKILGAGPGDYEPVEGWWHRVVALDPAGTGRDHPALVVTEACRVPLIEVDERGLQKLAPTRFDIMDAIRLDAGTSLDAQASFFCGLARMADNVDAELIVDATGLGIGVLNDLRRALPRVRGIVWHGW